MRPHLSTFVALLLLFTALGGGLSFLRHNFGTPHWPDLAAESDERFKRLKAALSGRSVAGYVGPDEYASYYLAQYSLAPVIVVYGTGPELIVADRREPEGMTLVEDFGGGLALYRK